MKKWNERPFEIRNLFNPAFCGIIILRSIQGYEEIDGSGMPFSLAILVLPICLHKETREIISSSSRSYLLKVLKDKPQILVGFAERTNSLLPYTFEAMGFTMQLQSFEITNNGRLKLREGGIRKKIDGTKETIECQRAAQIIGRKFAEIGDRVTIYTTLGIKP
jgi:hypothetical protein